MNRNEELINGWRHLADALGEDDDEITTLSLIKARRELNEKLAQAERARAEGRLSDVPEEFRTPEENFAVLEGRG